MRASMVMNMNGVKEPPMQSPVVLGMFDEVSGASWLARAAAGKSQIKNTVLTVK